MPASEMGRAFFFSIYLFGTVSTMNNSNICPIIFSNKGGTQNKLDHSLEYYEKETIEHVKKYLPIAIINNRKNLKDTKLKKIIQYILTNEDMLSNITTAIMLADFTHDQSRGSLRYWRTQNCLWTLNKTFYKNKIRPFPISDAHTKAESDGEYNYDRAEPSIDQTPLDDVLEKEEYSILEQKLDSLEKRKKEIIKLYYEDNLSESEIGKMYSISQQRVSKIIIETKKQLANERK